MGCSSAFSAGTASVAVSAGDAWLRASVVKQIRRQNETKQREKEHLIACMGGDLVVHKSPTTMWTGSFRLSGLSAVIHSNGATKRRHRLWGIAYPLTAAFSGAFVASFAGTGSATLAAAEAPSPGSGVAMVAINSIALGQLLPER
jgi:hypothetical protein